MMLTL